MIMTPTLVFPDDEVVKIDKHKDVNGEYDRAPHFSYQFNCTAGSAMRWALCTYTNIRTGEQNYSYYPKGGNISTFYNGDKVGINEVVFNDIAKNGHDYMYQYTLFQTDPTTIAGDTTYGDGTGLYDMYFCRGKIQKANSATKFTINKEIGNLKSAYYYTRSDDSVYLVGGAYIEIGEERRLIEKYSYSTGEVELKTGFSTAPAAGTVFRIFTNYFIDKPHYVKCRADPTCNLTAEVQQSSAYPIVCKTTYTHPNHIGLKYYKYYLYQVTGTVGAICDGTVLGTSSSNSINIGAGITNDLAGKHIMIEETPSEGTGHITEGISTSIQSYNIETGVAYINYYAQQITVGARYTIYNADQILVDESDEIYDFDLKYSFYANQTGNSFNIKSEIMTLDNKLYQYSVTKTFPSQSIDGKISDFKAIVLENHIMYLSWKTSTSLGVAKIFRRNVNEDYYVFLGVSNNKVFFDTTVGNKQTYIYYICYGDYNAFLTPQVSIDWANTGWSIYSLVNKGEIYNKKWYVIDSIWHFIMGFSENDITSNIGLSVHTGTGNKPKTTRTITDYESGSFTADLTTISCPDNILVDNIDRVKAWTEFIKGKNDFVLKSNKGDVWIINISEAPTRTYTPNSLLQETNIKYSWVEVEDINNVIISR